VFTLIEPNFLSVKEFSEKLTPTNSLGMETYRTMLDLGFWKKLVYIGLESKTALQVCYKFNDLTNFYLLSEFIEDKHPIINEWRSQLAMKDFWMQVVK